MKKSIPMVSIVMPVYNGERHIRSAIESVLNQSFGDFEYLIINDGSTDSSDAIIHLFTDPRINYTIQFNKGLTNTLNEALPRCRGTYIARMDQDDRSEPDRLKKQVDFLEQLQDVGLVGTTAYIMNEQGDTLEINPALLHDTELKLQLLYQTPFTHGSVMFRRSLLQQINPPFYRESAGNAEDYDFWSRLAPLTKLANLPEPLYGWRNSPTGMSNSESQKQKEFASRIILSNLDSAYFNKLLMNFEPNIDGYTNESIIIDGKSAFCNRKDNYSYFLYRLSSIMWNKGLQKRSVSFFLKALLSNPKYFLQAIFT